MAHCWKDQREHLADVHGWGTDAYWQAWHALWDGEHDKSGTCMLEDGHEEPHEFTPDDEIGVSFVSAEESPPDSVPDHELAASSGGYLP